ncbi:hypothetical protein [Micromonospora sonchi]|nr:hypothetical protein [Micromonospora sonchi]
MADLKHLAMLNSDGKARPPLRDPAGVKTALVDLRARVLARTPYDRLSARPRTTRWGQARDLVDLWLRHDTAATESDICDVCVIGKHA